MIQSMRQPCNILKGKNRLLRSRDPHFPGLLRMIDCSGVRSVLLNSVSDVILQRCMLSPPPPQQRGLFAKVCGLVKGGHLDIGTSSHLIKQAQEMSLLADWPCVFLWRPPTGTADMHSVSPWQRTHLLAVPLTARLTLSPPPSFPLTPIYSSTTLFFSKAK